MTSDPEEARLHPAGIAIAAIRHASSAWFVAVAVVAGAGPTVGAVIVLALAVVLSGLSYLEWRITRYAVVDGGLRYRGGLISRREVDIPASRISALDSTRGVLQRVFGVVALQVQTAGGGDKAELVLHAVSVAEAERLRRELGHRGAGRAAAMAGVAPVPDLPAAASSGGLAVADAPAGLGAPGADAPPRFVSPAAAVPDDAETVFTLTPRELLLAGLTSPSGAAFGAIAALLYGPLRDVFGDSAARSVESGVADAASGASGALLAIAALVVLAALLALSVLSTALQYAGFTVTRDAQRLRVRRGLLTERTGTVQLDRIHALRIVASPLREALGYVSIEAEVAGWAREGEVVKSIAPFVRRDALPELLPRLVPGFTWPTSALQRPPARATRRYVVRDAWLPALIAAALLATSFAPWTLLLGAAVIGGAVAMAWWRARTAGTLVDGRLVVLQMRLFARHTVVARIDRLQYRSAAVTPFQRRARLATIGVHLSSRRTVKVAFLDAAVVASLLRTLRPQVSHVIPRRRAERDPAAPSADQP